MSEEIKNKELEETELAEEDLEHVSGGSSKCLRYVVKHGDTLESIASKYNTTAAVLMSINNISNPSLIRIGQVIRIPSL